MDLENYFNLKSCKLAALCFLTLSACDSRQSSSVVRSDEKEQASSARSDVHASTSGVKQSIKPTINFDQTKKLFDSISKKQLGNVFDIELNDDGILIHPGSPKPTEVVFDVSNKFQTIDTVAFIRKLPESALDKPQVGTVNLEIFVDGKSQGLRSVDRLNNQSFSIDLTNAKKLKVVVDCAEGAGEYDWFILGIK